MEDPSDDDDVHRHCVSKDLYQLKEQQLAASNLQLEFVQTRLAAMEQRLELLGPQLRLIQETTQHCGSSYTGFCS